MAQILQSRTQGTTLHRVKAHANINGNEQVDALAKRGSKLDHVHVVVAYEYVHPHHTTSKKICGLQCKKHLTKAPLDTWINTSFKCDKRHNLAARAYQHTNYINGLKIRTYIKYYQMTFGKTP